MQRYDSFYDTCFLLYRESAWKTLFDYVIIYFLTKVEPTYVKDTQDSNPESREDAEEQLSKVRCESYSSEKDKRDSYDGKVQR